MDLRDIFLEATAEVQAVVREILEEWAEPMHKAQALQMWAQLTDEEKELYAQANPELIRELINERSQ